MCETQDKGVSFWLSNYRFFYFFKGHSKVIVVVWIFLEWIKCIILSFLIQSILFWKFVKRSGPFASSSNCLKSVNTKCCQSLFLVRACQFNNTGWVLSFLFFPTSRLYNLMLPVFQLRCLPLFLWVYLVCCTVWHLWNWCAVVSVVFTISQPPSLWYGL